MKKLQWAICVLAISVGCNGGSGPVAPSPTPSGPVLNTKVVDPMNGTTLQNQPVSIPTAPEPLILWIMSMSPSKGGVLSAYGSGSITWTCKGPIGYEVWISIHFMPPDAPAPTSTGPGLGPNPCEGINGNSVPPELSGMPIEKVRFLVWYVAKGEKVGFPSRPADTFIEEPLGWVVK